MIARTNGALKADLHTNSKVLEDFMLGDCPIRFFPEEQHFVHEGYDEKTKLYSFLDFPKKRLLDYLSKVDDNIGDGWYYVQDSFTGARVRMRAPDGEINDFSW